MLLFCIICHGFVQAQGRMLCIKNRTWNNVFMFMTWNKFCIFVNFICYSLRRFVINLFDCDVYFNTHGWAFLQ